MRVLSVLRVSGVKERKESEKSKNAASGSRKPSPSTASMDAVPSFFLLRWHSICPPVPGNHLGPTYDGSCCSAPAEEAWMEKEDAVLASGFEVQDGVWKQHLNHRPQLDGRNLENTGPLPSGLVPTQTGTPHRGD